MAENQPYVLHATAIVGCGISLFFCVLSLVGFSCFRPWTESMLIKKHLTVSVCATQIVFLVSIEGYKEEVGCRILSVLLHLVASACFSWCAIDALGLYFFHVNSFHPLRNTRLYLLLGWGIPCVVLILSLAVGLLDVGSTSTYNLSLYKCWSSKTIVWTLLVPCMFVTVVDIAILCTIIKQLRYPSYDISPKAIIEKRGTRYGLRTNSLMLIGLCIGWIFAILSFRESNNLRYQLVFGLVNGLQGIFLFFFHCLLNTDHVKGYSSTSGRTSNIEDGRNDTKKQETQTSTKKIGGQRSSKLENVPLISVNSRNNKQEEDNVVALPKTITIESCSALVDIVSEPLDDNKIGSPHHDVILQFSGKPDHKVNPQLPGTPDNDVVRQSLERPEDKIDEEEDVDRTKARPRTADNKLQVHEEESLERQRKSNSEPVISLSYEDSKRQDRTVKGANMRNSARLLDSQPRRPTRPHSSVNELESLFSRPDVFSVKPHQSSVSSLQAGSRITGNNKPSNEEKHRNSSSSTSTHESGPQGNPNEVDQ